MTLAGTRMLMHKPTVCMGNYYAYRMYILIYGQRLYIKQVGSLFNTQSMVAASCFSSPPSFADVKKFRQAAGMQDGRNTSN